MPDLINLVFDFETTKDPNHMPYHPEAKPVCVALGGDVCDGEVIWFHHSGMDDPHGILFDEGVQKLQLMVDNANRLIAHNLKFDLMWLKHLGIDYTGKLFFCTQVAEYILRKHQNINGLSLAQLAEDYGLEISKLDQVKEYWEQGVDTPDIPQYILEEYAVRDIDLCHEIFRKQLPLISEANLWNPISLDMAVIPALVDMEYNGCNLDIELLKQYRDTFSEKLQEIDTELQEILGIESVGSSDQLSAALFGGTYKVDGYETVQRELKGGRIKEYQRKAKIPKTIPGIGFDPKAAGINETKKPGVYEVNVPALSLLKPKTQTQRHVLALLRERSRVAQLLNMYFEGLQTKHINGIIHPNINQTVTATSRFSSSNPNSQNMPRGNTGPVKECFISRFNEGSDKFI